VPIKTQTVYFHEVFACLGHKTINATKCRNHPQVWRLSSHPRPSQGRAAGDCLWRTTYRASLLAGKETIPALVREMSDAEVLEAQLVELSIVGKSFLCLPTTQHIVYM
jgi:hypothetical protein